MIQTLFTYPFLIRLFNNIFNDNDKIKIISLNKFFNDKKLKFTYHKQIKINQEDQHKWYYDCLINVVVDNIFTFPERVFKLTFGDDFNQPIQKYVPNSVKYLVFGNNFNQPIDNCMSDYVEYLIFGDNFNQSINNIPKSLVGLAFGNNFNQPIKNNIPRSLKMLNFGWHFNQEIEDCLPEGLRILIFGIAFNQNLENCLPSSLTELTLGSRFDKNIEILPDSIINLKFQGNNSIEIKRFPSSLKSLFCSEHFYYFNKDKIPSNIDLKIFRL